MKTLLVAGGLAVIPVIAHSAELGMLNSLNRGSWNLRIRDDNSRQNICVRNGREFIQLRHKQPGCSHVIVKDTPSEVIVQYTCRGNGFGRTSIRREGDGLVQIQSQGIVQGTPFSISGEARYSGGC